MISRQPSIHVAFRVGAAVTVVSWLLATSLCSVEHLLGFDHHDSSAVTEEHAHDATAEHGHSHDAEHSHVEGNHSHDAESHSHGSHHHGDEEGSCCSTLQACVYVASPVVITKPVVHPLSLLAALLQAQAATLVALEKVPDRPPPDHDWVFTPEVCTGPANRSHAPPASV